MNEIYKFDLQKENSEYSDNDIEEEIKKLEIIDNFDFKKGRLSYEDFSEEPKYLPLMSEMAQEPWKDIHFKRSLAQFIQAKYKKRVKITNNFAEKIYRRMYDQRVRKNTEISRFMKVFLNPDITRSDYEFIQKCQRSHIKYIVFSQISLFSALGFSYFRGNLKKKIEKNMLYGFGVFTLPFVAMIGITAIYPLIIDRKVMKAGLLRKYQINEFI